jgi:hypothetical protein
MINISYASLGPVNTYFAARDGDDFVQRKARAARQSRPRETVSNEGLDEIRPVPLAARENAGAALQKRLALGPTSRALRALPAHFSPSNAGAK